MSDLAAYQAQFTAYLRDPIHNKPPLGARMARMRVYAEIVFNNIHASATACFPVCQQALGKRAWTKLVRGFFSDFASTTPIFREIPQQFLRYLETRDDLPPYILPLAHYEWIELEVSTCNVQLPHCCKPISKRLPEQWISKKLVLNPSLHMLQYDYAVQKISARRKPTSPLDQPVHLLVHRNVEHQVKFIETNEMTVYLLRMLQEGITAKQALLRLAEEISHPDPLAMMTFGEAILKDLAQQGVIAGFAD